MPPLSLSHNDNEPKGFLEMNGCMDGWMVGCMHVHVHIFGITLSSVITFAAPVSIKIDL